MIPMVTRIATFVILFAAIGGVLFWGERPPAATALAAKDIGQSDGVRVLEWSDLLPDGTIAFRPLDAASDFPEIASAPSPSSQFGPMTGADPFSDMPNANDPDAPRQDLAGQQVSLAGYMTPLMVENGMTRSFLLVPYVGACVHVPAPPPNQVVLVEAPKPIAVRKMWLPFRAVGKMHVETIDTGLAKVGYTMELARIEPYADDGKLEGTRSANDGD